MLWSFSRLFPQSSQGSLSKLSPPSGQGQPPLRSYHLQGAHHFLIDSCLAWEASGSLSPLHLAKVSLCLVHIIYEERIIFNSTLINGFITLWPKHLEGMWDQGNLYQIYSKDIAYIISRKFVSFLSSMFGTPKSNLNVEVSELQLHNLIDLI